MTQTLDDILGRTLDEASLVISIPLGASEVGYICGQAPVGDYIIQLDAIRSFTFPDGWRSMKQVDESDASSTLNQLVVRHLACQVVLKQHLIPDECLGTRMPVELRLLVTISFGGVLDKRAVNALGELEV